MNKILKYHQNYYNNNKESNPYCYYVIKPKLEKFEKVFADKKITLHEDNKEWAMNYIQGGKYSDAKQKEISHPAEAFICAIYQENFSLFNGNLTFR